jgi:AcrR family transcriptional regulator
MKAQVDSVTGNRSYVQRARAEASSRTRAAILDATMSLGLEKATADVSLADVSERAGVSVQTVLRHFGTRDGLIDEALRHAAARISRERRPASHDLTTAITTLFDHYESRGDAVIRLLAQEAFDERVEQITSEGRRVHREWVTEFLGASTADATESLIDQLVVVTDVYTWKLLRRDRRLARPAAQDRVLGMVEAMLRTGRGGQEGSP